jgi:ABC-type antimicrobial peptide transport system permease subunit
LMAALPGIVREIDPTVRVRGIRTMGDVVNGSLYRERLVAQLGGFFGIFALALACLGLYGVVALTVAQRTREIGVRVALGAPRADLLWLVTRRGMLLTTIGAAIGIGTASIATRGLSALLYGVEPTDP